MRYDGGRVEDVEIESRSAASVIESVDVCPSESDCVDTKDILWGLWVMFRRNGGTGKRGGCLPFQPWDNSFLSGPPGWDWVVDGAHSAWRRTEKGKASGGSSFRD